MKVYIIGNSGAARECHLIYEDKCRWDVAFAARHEFGGFLAWKAFPGDLKSLAHLAAGDADAHEIRHEDRFVIGIGEPHLRKEIFSSFKARGAMFMNLIHPWGDVAESASLGEANVVQRGSVIFCDARIGDGNYLNGSVSLAHDVTIGDFNFIGPFSTFLGGSSVGSLNSIAVQTTFLPKARMGDNNITTPGSFLYKGCRDNCRMAGNPALKIGTVERNLDHA